MFNQRNLSVYVDWMIDKDGLPPEKQNGKTFEVLKVRMQHCDSVLYVHTNNCRDSSFIPEELNFAIEEHLPLVVWNVEDTKESENMQLLPHLIIQKDKLFVKTYETCVSYENWLVHQQTSFYPHKPLLKNVELKNNKL